MNINTFLLFTLTIFSLWLFSLFPLFFSWLKNLWREYFPLREDIYIFHRSERIAYLPHFHQWFPRFLFLWGIPIFLASRSFHLRNQYLPLSWDPLPFLGEVGNFLLSLPWVSLFLLIPSLALLWEWKKYLGIFFLWLKTQYYWLLIRLRYTGMEIFFAFLFYLEKKHMDKFLREMGWLEGKLYSCTLWIYRPGESLKIWLILIPLDLYIHGGIFQWSLSFLPFWAWLILLWRSWSFLVDNGGDFYQREWLLLLYHKEYSSNESDLIFQELLIQELSPYPRRKILALKRWKKIRQRKNGKIY